MKERNIVVLVCFGEKYKKMLSTLLKSIEFHSGTFDVLVLTDTHKELPENTHVHILYDSINGYCARYQIFQWEHIWKYSKALYLDLDVATFRSLDVLFEAMNDFTNDTLHVLKMNVEGFPDRFGRELFRNNNVSLDDRYPINSGQFSFYITKHMKSFFTEIEHECRNLHDTCGFFTDQMCLNYLIAKNSISIDFSIFEKYGQIAKPNFTYLKPEIVFVHFAGKDESKVQKLETILDLQVNILISSQRKLQWYNLVTCDTKILREDEIVHYGIVPIENDIALTTRALPWNQPSDELILLVDTSSSKVLQTAKLPSVFTHDMVKFENKIYVTDTENGNIWELLINNLSVSRKLNLFTRKEHVNTVAIWPFWPGENIIKPILVAVLHNQGPSQLVHIDIETGEIIRRLENIGLQSHGAVLWEERYAIVLSSGESSLIKVDILSNGTVYTLWKNSECTFTKGLCVINDIAYFGISPFSNRDNRFRTMQYCELAAFDLVKNILLWKRPVETNGLINVLAAPQYGELSTSVAIKNSCNVNTSFHFPLE
jgi:hypothetical protein